MLQRERSAYPAAVPLQTEMAAAAVRFANLHRVCTVRRPHFADSSQRRRTVRAP
jgi:hypothetical protein